ncbi:hypothetical protein E4L96_17710 [Massilia arenosa]|uniref:Tetratricopeptide repeat protein n=1 Tax=Zemynaea arenosa TaxID=2561931 RepID=A0A4Y9S308_9BURK|nr:tetratricopeptide repeat protein [Massilia arenosa]TFW15746.1 hypothetical protein E4L96_17710 [Massilia arenosa]
MSQFRLARISLLLAAIGLQAAPALITSAHAQSKPAAEAPKPDTVRAEMYKFLDPKVIQEKMAAKDYAYVQDAITKAEAFPDRTPYESYVIDRMKISLGSATNNNAMTVGALERAIASGRLTPEEKSTFMLAMAEIHYDMQDYKKSIPELEAYLAQAANPHAGARGRLARAYYLNKDYAKAVPMLKAAVDSAEKAGQQPSNEDLRLLTSAAGLAKDNDTTLYALERVVKYYPSDDAWTNLLSRLVNRPGFDQKTLMPDVFRLQSVAVQQMDAAYIVELAETDLLAGLPTEAKKVVDAGFASGSLGTGPDAAAHKKLRDRANKGAAEDAKSSNLGETSAAKAKDGTGLVNVGYAYVSMDQFDKGIDLIQKGIAKGVKAPEEAKIRLGIAYAKAGRKDDALKTFASVGGDQNTKDLARYWSMWVNRPAGGAAAPAAAPAAPAPASK